MGMYDTIRVLGLPALTCAARHEIRELQTKDLENVMADYVLHEGRLYRVHADSDGTVTAEAGARDALVVISRRLADPLSLTSEVVAYASCDECRPVLYVRDAGGRRWGDYINERYPWCEWKLVFAAGRLERRDAHRLDTRDAMRRELLAQGLEVLDDDDRLARMHFRRLESTETEIA